MHEGVKTEDIAHRWRVAALTYFHDVTLKAALEVRKEDIVTDREGLGVKIKGKEYWIPPPPSSKSRNRAGQAR